MYVDKIFNVEGDIKSAQKYRYLKIQQVDRLFEK
jgi:hypothetical protein